MIAGNLEPQGFPSGAIELGPVDPRHPPSALVAMAHHRPVSIVAPGPATPSHQPRRRMVGTGRAGDVRIAGQCVQHHDDVVAFGVQLAPALHRDRYIVEDRTAFQRQGADLDDRRSHLRRAASTARRSVCRRWSSRPCSHRRGTLIGTARTAFAAANPWSRSARMSSIPSIPTARRTSPGVTPVVACSSGVSWACVVDAQDGSPANARPRYWRHGCAGSAR